MAHEKHSIFHPYDPFDDSVPERLRRMGLLTAGGKPDRDAMAVVSRLYAGAFYDDLYDFYSDIWNDTDTMPVSTTAVMPSEVWSSSPPSTKVWWQGLWRKRALSPTAVN